MTGTTESAESKNRADARIEVLKEILRAGIPQLCLARVRLITESQQMTQAEPVSIAQAKALSHVLANIKIAISDGELIVGNMSEVTGRRAAVIKPEDLGWLSGEMDNLAERTVDRAFISEADKKSVREMLPFWKGRTVREKAFYMMPDDLKQEYLERADALGGIGRVRDQGLSEMSPASAGPGMGSGEGLVAGLENNETVLTRGLEGIAGEAEAYLQGLESADPNQLARIHFYRSVIISTQAVTAFAQRYARLAGEMASRETDSLRKAELSEIAAICEHAPAKPARTFHEALQAIWLMHIALHIEGSAGAWGRLDQYLFPYYQRDLAEGRLDRERAKELLQCFYLKLNSWENLAPLPVSQYFAPGGSVGQNITLGGMGRDGRDVTNELSYLLLETDGDLCLMEPETVVRFHKDMPLDLAVKTCEVAKQCRGKIKFIGDNATIGKLVNQGHALEDARDYAIQGCFEPYAANITSLSPGGAGAGVGINLLLFLELALNDGVGVVSGRQLGPRTGDPGNFKSIQDVLKAFRAQVAYFTGLNFRSTTAGLEASAQYMAIPLRSALIKGCLETGTDLALGGAQYNAIWSAAQGAINTADALAAIRKCVFDDGKLTMDELLAALRGNFEGKEDLRQMLLEAPKFGNDDDYVDLLAREVISIFAEEWQKHSFSRGNRHAIAQLEGLPNIIPMGWRVGASADGRRSGETLADGGVSPVQGRNTKGVIATMKSVAKIDHTNLQAGEGLNMRISPDSLKDDRAMQKFAIMVKTYLTELGGFHCQFNIVSSEMLRDAQQHPEQYRDLLVRVATYTAYFVELSTDVQENIISWSELGLA